MNPAPGDQPPESAGIESAGIEPAGIEPADIEPADIEPADIDPEDWTASSDSRDERLLRERPPHW
jgi:hypothetical protein